jgi:tetratricopeptide (TPR) repeat protein
MASATFDELCGQARQAVGSGNYQEGQKLYAHAINAAPDSADAHYGFATCCFMLGDFENAQKHFREVTRLDPLRATAFINLGALYNRLGQQDDAIASLRKGLQLDPRRAEGYYNLGIAYRQKGMTDLAIQSYREATRLNPRMADACLNLANLLLETQRFGDAVSFYQQAISVRPNFEKAINGLRTAEQALAKAKAPATAVTATAPSASDGASPAEPSRGFSNIAERTEAMELLRDSCSQQDGYCQEMARVLEQRLTPSIKDLSRSLVGTPALGELEIHVDAYEKALEEMRTARRNMDDTFARIRDLGDRFTAAAEGEPVT